MYWLSGTCTRSFWHWNAIWLICGCRPCVSASCSPRWCQLDVRQSCSVKVLHPASSEPARSSGLIHGFTSAAVRFPFAFLPALRVAGHVHLDAVRLALRSIDVILALHGEDGVAEAQVVPVGLAASGVVEAGAAAEEQRSEHPESHTGPTRPPAGYSGSGLLGLDARGAGEIAVDAGNALDFTLRRKALVEAFLLKLARHLGPRTEALFPALHAPGFGLGVVARKVGAHPHHGLDGHRLGDHVVVLAPHAVAEHAARGFEEVADDGVVARHFLRAAAGELDRAPAAAHPAMQLVEQLRLQHPFVALAAAAEAVDAVAQRAVAFAVEPLDQPRGELAVGRGERHVLVEVDEVALVDARRRRIDDDEHLGGEILAAPVEDDAGHVDGPRVVGTLVQVEAQRREAVLAIDDQVLGRGLAQAAGRAVAVGAEVEALGGEQQHRAGNRRLRDRRLVEVLELAHLGARQRALEGVVVALDLGDELRDVVVFGDAAWSDLLVLAVEAADEAHLRQQVLGAVADEVKDAVLLPDLRRLHSRLSVCPTPLGGQAEGANTKGKSRP